MVHFERKIWRGTCHQHLKMLPHAAWRNCVVIICYPLPAYLWQQRGKELSKGASEEQHHQ
jgi:hypothetical protein